MDGDTLIFRVSELPDATSPVAQMRAGGDVSIAVETACMHLMHLAASTAPGSMTLAIALQHDPDAGRKDPQKRDTIYLAGQAHSKLMLGPMKIMLEQSLLHQPYRLEPIERIPGDRQAFCAACDVVRYQSLLPSAVPPDLNVEIPDSYLMTRSFEPNHGNRWEQVDMMLDSVDEPVLIEICIEPADVRPCLQAHTRYMSILQSVNRPWETDVERALGDWDSRDSIKSTPLKRGDLLAEEIRSELRTFHQTLLQLHLRFHIRVYTGTRPMAKLVASQVAQCAFGRGIYQLHDHAPEDPLFQRAVSQEDFRVLPLPVTATLSDKTCIELYEALSELQHLATVDELAGVFCLPVASRMSPRCIRKATDPPHIEQEELLILGFDQTHANGTAGDHRPRVPRGPCLVDVGKHASLFGMSGSGKTFCALILCVELYRKGIPFLILEPVKSEWRLLKCLASSPNADLRRLAQDLHVYRPGSGRPMRFNPLERLPAISIDEQALNVLACLMASAPLPGPLLFILMEALYRIYYDRPTPQDPPTLADLYEAAHEALAAKGYSSEVMSNLQGALDTRIGALVHGPVGHVFRCRHSVQSIEQLATGFSLIELGSLPPEAACLFTLFLLTTIGQYVKATPHTSRQPRLIVFLEEAHNIVGRHHETTPSAEFADPKACASDLICRMLAEFRALGVGIVIIDQHPSAIAEDVIKSTATKVCFRQTWKDDRDTICSATLGSPSDHEELARFLPGQALLSAEGYSSPCRIKTVDIREAWQLPALPVAEAILPYLVQDSWFQKETAACIASDLEILKEGMDAFDVSRLNLIQQETRLASQLTRLLAAKPTADHRVQLERLAQRAATLRYRLRESLKTFDREVYLPLLGSEPVIPIDSALEAFRASLVSRFANTITPGIEDCIARLNSLLVRCRQAAMNPTH